MTEHAAGKLSHRTMSEGVEHLIRTMILNGSLHPSERINEAQLADDFGMSRGPIREALRRLQTEGLVVYHPHKGTYVATLSKKDAHEIYTLRGLLEAEAVRLALPNLTTADVQELQNKIHVFETARQQKDIASLVRCDQEFHHIVVRAAHHSRLFDVYKTLDTQLGAMFMTIQARAPKRLSQVADIHQVLVNALKGGDEEVVMQTFRDHYIHAYQAIAAVTPE